ncbi:MAG: hypothetical protein L6Q95_18380 [Planctomycetes bacterium]|nr:hypothetical protein [Planctomycetota bacterium]
MATRLNITIPDELFERLEAYRDRMNISAVCASALETELVTMAKLAKIKRKDLQDAVERLRKERESAADTSRQQGLGDGVEMTKGGSVGYRKIKWFVADGEARADAFDFPSVRDRLFADELMRDFARDTEDPRNPTPPDDWDSYWDGFAEGVLKVWEEIGDEVDA